MTSSFPSMDHVLLAVLRCIEREGRWVSPRGIPTNEVTGLSFTLSDPRARTITNRSRRWSESYAVGELCWHLSASDRLQEIAYYSTFWNNLSADGETITGSCYGKRIFGASAGDSPWKTARNLLRDDPATRRAVVHLTPPAHPTARDLDVPCIATIQFLVRDGKLDCHVGMRSCDVIYGLCYDVYFVTMLQEMMCLELAIDLGSYHQTTASMHHYARHSDLVRRVLRQVDAPIKPMRPMTDLDGVAGLLDIERQLREHPAQDPCLALRSLSPYWRALAEVLVAKAARRPKPDYA